MEWVPGGVWVASMLPDLSGFVETLKDAVRGWIKPRTGSSEAVLDHKERGSAQPLW